MLVTSCHSVALSWSCTQPVGLWAIACFTLETRGSILALTVLWWLCPAAGVPLRVERLLANLGYGKRRKCAALIKQGRLVYTDTGAPAKVSPQHLAPGQGHGSVSA
jgi:hypothetical protein